VDLSLAVWRKSTASQGQGQCVEVAVFSDGVAVRDGKHPGGPALAFTPAEWDAFLAGAKDGEFDRPT